MGDLHQIEAQLSIPNTGVVESSQAAAGMGDLRRVEAQRNQRILDAEKARWVAMGEYYLEKQAQKAHRSLRSLDAERARWMAMGEYYTAKQDATSAVASTRPSAGIGDLRWFESQQSIPNAGAGENGHTYAGTGDLRRFEAAQAVPNTGSQESGHTYAGTGDLRRFDAQQVIPDKGGQESSSSYTGRGDYQIFEAELLLLNAGAPVGMGDLRRLEAFQELLIGLVAEAVSP
jgi:hypothetical protein